nr:hypothetical protein [Nostoc sp. EkiNYC01]
MQEAERLLDPDLITTPDFNLLRRRYLGVLLRDLPLQIHQQGLLRGVDQDSLSEGTSPSTQSTASTSRKSRVTHSPSEDLRLEELASTVGCVAVLQNLQKMVKSLRESPWQADSSIKGAVNTFTRAKCKEALGSLEQDYSSLRVARRFRELVVDCRAEAAALRKKRKRGQPYSDGKRGVGADSQAYDRLLDECGEDATLLRDDLKKANEHGRRLLEYENISGLEHPIWMLFPAENTKCPIDESFL